MVLLLLLVWVFPRQAKHAQINEALLNHNGEAECDNIVFSLADKIILPSKSTWENVNYPEGFFLCVCRFAIFFPSFSPCILQTTCLDTARGTVDGDRYIAGLDVRILTQGEPATL